MGIAGTFSFQSSKLMTAGEGGIIITNDDAFERRARSVHDCGRMPGEWFYSHYINGSNYRLSEWQGAVLSAQLTRLDAQTQRRHQNARLLDQLLAQIPGITPQKLDSRCTRNGQYAYIFHVELEGIRGRRHRTSHPGHERGRHSESGQLSAHSPSGCFQERRISQAAVRLTGHREPIHSFGQSIPQTHRAAWESIWIPQPALLGDEEDIHEIAAAWRKDSEVRG